MNEPIVIGIDPAGGIDTTVIAWLRMIAGVTVVITSVAVTAPLLTAAAFDRYLQNIKIPRAEIIRERSRTAQWKRERRSWAWR